MPAENDILAVEFDKYGGPEVLKLRRIAPPQPAPGEVLIRCPRREHESGRLESTLGHAAEILSGHLPGDHRA